MKNILITGISSGIGKYLVENLTENIHIYGISRNFCEYPNMTFLQGDLQKEEFLKYINEQIGELDYIIHNAGVGYFDDFSKIGLDEHQEQISTNLLSPILLTSLLIGKVKKGIIFIGSVSSKKSGKYGASYSASKFGIRGFAMNLKNEYPQFQIHIINPKIIDTGFHKNSKIQIVGKYQSSSLEDILLNIKNIFEKKESRFEIDI